jgi:hypothetical protein
VLEVDTGNVVWYDTMDMYSSVVTAVCTGPGPEAKKRAEQARKKAQYKQRVVSSKPGVGGKWQGGKWQGGTWKGGRTAPKAIGAKAKPQV